MKCSAEISGLSHLSYQPLANAKMTLLVFNQHFCMVLHVVERRSPSIYCYIMVTQKEQYCHC